MVIAIALAVFLIDGILIPRMNGHPFNAGRPDYLYMADAFLHGRLWLDVPWRAPINDLIMVGEHVYVPFQPFPALVLMPLVWLVGLHRSIELEPLVNAALTGVTVALAWVLLGRLGVRRWSNRLWLTVLFGFGTVIWNITVRGGVWHTAEILAAGLTLWALAESRASRPRPWLLGILGGAAFLCRAPLVFAFVYYAWVVAGSPKSLRGLRSGAAAGARGLARLLAGFAPFLLGFFAYNWGRFGSPLETGYALATLPPWLEALRAQGLFALRHLTMNLDYLFLRGPILKGSPDQWSPGVLGMSVLYTSPALLVGLRMLWRSAEARMLGLAGLLVLIPTLLYYGGGWTQFGYRYLLDSIPFWLALCGLAAARFGVGWIWRAAIAWSVVANAWLTYWATRI